jgi:hypothetical protein
MERVRLLDYFNLSKSLSTAEAATLAENNNIGAIYFATRGLHQELHNFVVTENGFSACKNVASELISEIEKWRKSSAYDEDGKFDIAKFDEQHQSWNYSSIRQKISDFRSVFEAESVDLDVYFVEPYSIYQTSALVSNGSDIIPSPLHEHLPKGTVEEFNSAGKCLAFDLPTACGFHALRGLELVMENYLRKHNVNKKMHSWNDFIKAVEKLIEDAKEPAPSQKVAAMIDRMRTLDRNPLMHPTNTLDIDAAHSLFTLCAITSIELTHDLQKAKLSKKH